jgi:hypothetical protein
MIFVACSPAKKQKMAVEKSKGKLVVFNEEQDLLTYQFEMHFPPEGIDSIYKRSAFIHPLKTPSGKVITEINPEDHRHHYGVWNPWTKVEFKGDTVDFWNLHEREGTVRHAGFKEITEEGSAAGYRAYHEHVVIKGESEEVALHEIQTVTVQQGQDDKYRIDFEIELTPATQSPFNILEYRYGGFGWRATSEWTDSTSFVLTSEGIDRSGADGSLARWVVLQGKLGERTGGALLISHPENKNHPEPIRVWPEGDLFITMFPTKYGDWKLEPEITYTLKYRMVVFDGEMDAESAENEWIKYTGK